MILERPERVTELLRYNRVYECIKHTHIKKGTHTPFYQVISVSIPEQQKRKCGECEFWKDDVCVAYSCVEAGEQTQSLF